ncbi:MAG: molybdopterin dinucleotide binding domain-containing protein, partial [Halodesulfurarchaeum sp.]
FFHPFTPAQDPPWEARSDWEAFKGIASKVSELAAEHFDGPVKDVVVSPLMTDSEDEIANLDGELFDWKHDDTEAVPGETMPNIAVEERDYTTVYERFVTLGEQGNEPGGYGAKNVEMDLSPIYEDLTDNRHIPERDGRPSLESAKSVAEVILRLSPETDGRVSTLLFEDLEEQMGRDLSDLYAGQAHETITFDDLEQGPTRTLTSPHWTGIESTEGSNDRTYAPWAINVEKLKPWKTLTGRQEVYFDHEVYRELGEELPTYKPPVDTVSIGEVDTSEVSVGPTTSGPPEDGGGATDSVGDGSPPVGVFRYLTPHGKWQIHSSFRDTWQMTNLSRGGPVAWLNDEVAEALGIEDNDWMELYTENGIQVARAVISHTVPRDAVICYHQVERHVNVPFSEKAQEEGVSGLRGGTNNSPTRIMQNPATMVGGYANWTYFINYWGTSPSERDMPVAVRRMPLDEGESPVYREEELPVDPTVTTDGGEPR